MSDGGRKYNITLLVIVLTVLCAAFGWIHETTIKDLFVSALGMYGGLNVMQKAADWATSRLGSSPAAPPAAPTETAK